MTSMSPLASAHDPRLKLTPKQVRALEVLAETGDLAAAAASVNVSDRTLRRWRSTDAWCSAYAVVLRERGAAARDRLVGAMPKAVTALERALTGGTAATRVRAAKVVLELGLDAMDDDVEERLARLEKEAASWDGPRAVG